MTHYIFLKSFYYNTKEKKVNKDILNELKTDNIALLYNRLTQKLVELSKPEISVELQSRIGLTDFETYFMSLLENRNLYVKKINEIKQK